MNGLIRRSRSFRALASLVAMVVFSVGVVTATATEARAGMVEIIDSLEGSTPWTRWQGGGSGDGIAGYDINGGVAHSGANDGWLHVGNGWAANRIPVNLNAGFYYRSNCVVAVWFNVLYSGAAVGLQVWNPNGWHIVAETYPWVAGGGYRQVYISGLNLQGYSGDIYLQVIYGNDNGVKTWVRFDDMQLRCYY
ncbi:MULTISPECIES: hypothetical protein [Streptosporangium]|uniref:Carbohydrate-binding protein n=1 Tax=Streptosporangium brasiliense TaxID=47480 RepID=A0ABT9RN52_9ACTN|nr:hypothetical protein [Streptosporangium brasiliense]MDP9869800.1 hypothetical protein [Streptosporangium brasiliense]